MLSAWVNQAHRYHSQGGDTRQKEIIPSTKFYKVRKVAANEWRIRAACIALHHIPPMTAVIAHQHIVFIAETRIVTVLNPLLLHEFKLTRKAGVQRHED